MHSTPRTQAPPPHATVFSLALLAVRPVRFAFTRPPSMHLPKSLTHTPDRAAKDFAGPKILVADKARA